MKRRWIGALLILCLLMGQARGEMQLTPEEFDEGFAPYCQWDGTTLTLNEGIVTLGEYLGDLVETEKGWNILLMRILRRPRQSLRADL